ncbi:MAG: MFS transporter [Myxococcales bacterium]|nr:MFS transporter [Myxococcales bacterium]
MAGKLGIGTKAGYGVGAAAEAGVLIAFNAFNMIFYQNVLGLSGALAGMAVSISLMFDAVSDPLVGAISDRWRSRMGRRHPFLYVASIPFGACFYLIYAPPAFILGSQALLFSWLMVLTIMLRTFQTFYHVPHLALGAELATEYKERSVLMSYNSIFGMVGGVAVSVAGFQYLGAASGRIDDVGAYANMGAVVGLLGAAIIVLTAVATAKRGAQLSKVPDLPPFSTKQFIAEIRSCLQNENYRYLLIGLVCLGPFLGVRETLATHLTRFFWEVPVADIGKLALAVPPAFVLMFLFVPRMHQRYSKRALMLGGLTVAAISAGAPITLRLLGLLPDNSDPFIYRMLLVERFVFYLGISTLTMSVMSALGDVADEHDLATGRRQEGVFYSARSFFGKVTQAAGHLVAGIALDLIGFESGSKVGEVPEDVLVMLGLVDGPVAAAFGLGAAYFYARYKIDPARHAEIRESLAKRHSARPPEGAAAES